MTLVVFVGNGGCKAYHCGRRFLWTLTSVGIFMLNLIMQFGLSYILYASSVEHSEDKYENGLSGRMNVIENALSDNKALSESSASFQTVEMCSHELASVRGWIMIYYFVVFIWYARMIQEISETMWISAVVWQVPSTAPSNGDNPDEAQELMEGNERGLRALSDADANGNAPRKRIPTLLTNSLRSSKSSHMLPRALTQAMDEEQDNIQMVVRVSPCLRCAILFIVVFWKLTLACWVAWVGAKFLTLSPSTACLVIKSLSLQFVVQIDELLFKSFASLRRQDEVARSQLIYQKPEMQWWSIWGSSLFRFVLAVAATVLTLDVAFGEITSFRLHCYEYFTRFPQPHKVGEGLTNLLF